MVAAPERVLQERAESRRTAVAVDRAHVAILVPPQEVVTRDVEKEETQTCHRSLPG